MDKGTSKVDYLPMNLHASLHISPVKKVLYRFCEDLANEELNVFLSEMWKVFPSKDKEFKHFDFLEMYFLYWETISFVTLANAGQLIRVLKTTGRMNYYQRLEELIPDAEGSKSGLKKEKEVIKAKNKILEDSEKLRGKSELRYEIDADKPGVCLIINQINFYREPPNTKYHVSVGVWKS